MFKKVDDLMVECARYRGPVRNQKFCFCVKFAGGNIFAENKKNRSERYLSTNLLPFTHQRSVELRRQGGVASAESAIHRVRMSSSSHVYPFSAVSRVIRSTYAFKMLPMHSH